MNLEDCRSRTGEPSVRWVGGAQLSVTDTARCHRLLESLALSREALYCFCGSRGFIDDMIELLAAWGVPVSQLKYEKWW